MPERFDRILEKVREAGVKNPYAVAQVTYRKSLAKGVEGMWLRITRNGRTILSVLVPRQKSVKRAAMYWSNTANVKEGDIVTVYDPKSRTSKTTTFVVEWRD